jgi:hypothetical protein
VYGGRGFRVAAHWLASVPNRRTINAVTGGDWDGTGVLPDVRVPAAQALEVAQKLAAGRR